MDMFVLPTGEDLDEVFDDDDPAMGIPVGTQLTYLSPLDPSVEWLL